MSECLYDLEDKCKEQLDTLSKSASFIMSLGAKELYHSNFLAFLIESNAEIPINVQNNLKKLFGLDGDKKVHIWRERKNFDLVLIQADIEDENAWMECKPKIVIIENKLKSIPTVKQLKEYDDKLSGKVEFPIEFFLEWKSGDKVDESRLKKDIVDKIQLKGESVELYVYRHDKSRREIVGDPKKVRVKKVLISTEEFNEQEGWGNITWQKIRDEIGRGLTEGEQNKKPLIPELIKDYVCALCNILGLVDKISNFHHCFVENKLKELTCKDFYEQTKSKRFRQLRIHDLVGKIAFNKLEKTLLVNLENDDISEKINSHFILNSYTFYSRQQPGIGFEWLWSNGRTKKEEKRFSIGVQIQGSSLAHFVEFYPSYDGAENFANKMKTWLYPEEAGFKGNIRNPDQLLRFNNKKFLYTKISIEEFSFGDLSKRVATSLLYGCEILKNNESEFLNEIKVWLDPIKKI